MMLVYGLCAAVIGLIAALLLRGVSRHRRITAAIGFVGEELRARMADDAGWRRRFAAGDDSTMIELVEAAALRAGITRTVYEEAIHRHRSYLDQQRAILSTAMAGGERNSGGERTASRAPLPFAKPSSRLPRDIN